MKFRFKIHSFLATLILFFSFSASAMLTELGLTYGYNKKTFDANNYYQMDSKSASVSLYFTEWAAVELSYTDMFIEQQQKDSASTRVIQQSTKILGADLNILLANRQAMLQPYIKGGVARISKSQTTRTDNLQTEKVDSPEATAPSYGAGIKIKLTEAFSLKLGVEYWRTPLGDGTSSDDSSFKAGLSWMF